MVASSQSFFTIPDDFPSISAGVTQCKLQNVNALRLRSGFTFNSSENCGVAINDFTSFSIFSDGGNAIVDCQGLGVRCLDIQRVSNLTISGITLLNGQATSSLSLSAKNNKIRHDHKMLPRRRQQHRNQNNNNKKKEYSILEIKVSLTEDGEIVVRRKHPKITQRKQAKKRDYLQQFITDGLQEAISISGGCLLVRNCGHVTLNKLNVQGGTSSSGGGLAIWNSQSVFASELNIAKNGILLPSQPMALAHAFGGGAVFINISLVSISNTKINSNGFIVNSSIAHDSYQSPAAYYGAGIGFLKCIQLLLDSVEFTENFVQIASASGSSFGGGMGIMGCTNVTGWNLVISKNKLFGYGGDDSVTHAGGIFVNNTDTISIFESEMQGNVISTVGYAVSVFGAATGFNNINRFVMIDCSIFNNSVESSTSASYLVGGGLYLVTIQSALLQNLVISNNIVRSNSSVMMYMYGAGIWIADGFNIHGSNLNVTNNALIGNAAGKTSFMGGGMYAVIVQNLTFSRCNFLNNSIQIMSNALNDADSNLHPAVPTTTANPVVVNTCAPNVVIPDVAGSIEYSLLNSSEANCFWEISPQSSNDGSLMVLNVTIDKLNLGVSFACLLAIVTIYDGPSTLSPIIGNYCGVSAQAVCFAGPCPLHHFVSSGPYIIITFKSQLKSGFASSSSAFKISWQTVSLVRTDGQSSRIWSPSLALPCSLGGGIAAIQSNAVFDNCEISGNFVVHPTHAGGGGVMLNGFDGIPPLTVHFNSTSIHSNRVESAVAIAGAMMVGSVIAEMNNSTVRNNSVVAQGHSCFWSTVETNIVCPSAHGGGFGVYEGSIYATSSKIFENTVTCQATVTCEAHGAAMGIDSNGKIFLSQSECSHNFCNCLSAGQGCSGGCGNVYSGTLTFSRSIVDSNAVLGVGWGGGASALETSFLNVVNGSVFRRNSAREGGALFGSGQSVISVLGDSRLESNAAGTVGGAIAITEESELVMSHTSMENNTAARATALFAYNSNGRSKYHFDNVDILADVGMVALVLGPQQMDTVMWNSTRSGTVLTTDLNPPPSFFSLSFSSCTSETYSIGNASSSLVNKNQCYACPAGGVCTEPQELLAQPEFWGKANPDTGEAQFFLCPYGYCCSPSSSSLCAYNYCQGGRTGDLCGVCPSGFGLQFFSSSCVASSSCNDAGWAIPLLLISGVVVVTFLVAIVGRNVDIHGDLTDITIDNNDINEDLLRQEEKEDQRNNNGSLAVLLFFYQAAPLVKSTPWKLNLLSGTIQLLQSVFNLAPNEVGGDSSSSHRGICLLPHMNQQQKMGLSMFLSTGSAGFAVILHLIFRHQVKKLPFFRNLDLKIGTYIAVMTRITSILYTTYAVTTLQLIQCIYFEKDSRWWFNASVECMQPWQQASVAAFILLSLLPIVLMILLYQWQQQQQQQQQQQSSSSSWNVIYRSLSLPYKKHRKLWAGVSLFRRLLVAMVFALVGNTSWKSMTMTTLIGAFLVVHIRGAPFESRQIQVAESISLILLFLLSVSVSPTLVQLQLETDQGLVGQMGLEIVQIIIVIIPGLAWLCKMGSIAHRKYKRRKILREKIANGKEMDTIMINDQ